MTKTKSILTIFLCLLATTGYGQNLKGNVGPDDKQKPNASKGGLSSDIVNVDLFTGTAAIGMPIYERSVSGLDLSISLSYTAKGIRVDELASPVGLGWQLQYGGSITRDVNGLEDEVKLPTSFMDTLGYSIDSLQGYLSPGAIIDPNNIDIHDDDKEPDLFHIQFSGRSVDLVFKYDGATLKYYTFPKSEIRVEFQTKDIVGGTYTNIRHGVGGKCGLDSMTDVLSFIITDEQGNKFYFDRGDYQEKEFKFDNVSAAALAASDSFTATTGIYYPITSWDLVQVKTYDGFTINYEYENRHVEYVETVTEQFLPFIHFHEQDTATLFDPFKRKEQVWKGTKTHVKKIYYQDNTTATFNFGTSSRCDCENDFILNNIVIESRYDANVANTARYQFNHSYLNTPMYGFNSLETTNSCGGIGAALTIPSNLDHDSAVEKHLTRGLRLKLNSIDLYGTDDVTKERYYTFEYNTTSLPYRFAPSKDYYGYYNGNTPVPHIRTSYTIPGGKDSIYTSIPYPANVNNGYYDPTVVIVIDSNAVHARNFGLDRSYDFNYAQAAVLKKIKNNAGGTTELVYQDYTLTNPDCSYNELVLQIGTYMGSAIIDSINCEDIDTELQGSTDNDGLCIWKIISSDSFSSQNSSLIEYTLDSGQRFNRGGYCWYFNGNNPSDVKVYNNFFVGPLSLFKGSNHGFSNVTVTKKGYNNKVLGKTNYSMSNLIYYDVATSAYRSRMTKPTGPHWHTMPGEFRKFGLGIPDIIREYDENNVLASEVVNEYEKQTDAAGDVRITEYFGNVRWEYSLIDFERLRLKKTTNTGYLYDPVYVTTKSMTNSSSFFYDANDNPTHYRISDSRGNIFTSYVKYNYNYSALTPSIGKMNADKVQYPVFGYKWKSTGTDSVIIEASSRTPDLITADSILRFIGFFGAKMSTPITTTQWFLTPAAVLIEGALKYKYTGTTGWGTHFKKNQEVTLYDDQSNIVEYRYNNREQYSSFIYEKRTGNLLAKAQNARYSDIAFTSFETPYDSDEDPSRGNWRFNTGGVTYYNANPYLGDAKTGSYAFNLTSGELESKPLTNTKYVLSFWIKKNAMPEVGLYDGPSPVSTVSLQLVNQVGQWQLYTATIEPNAGWTVKLSQPSTPPIMPPTICFVDEIRLHPADAVMTSFTYIPMFGLGTVNDASNYILNYDYDAFGRLKTVKDMRGYIREKYETAFTSDLSPACTNCSTPCCFSPY